MYAKGKTLEEWIKIYEEKTEDEFNLPKDFRLFYLAERGFASMKLDLEGKMVIVYQVCGDGKFWRDFAELAFAGPFGLDAVCSICTREIYPYIRAFNWEIIEKQEKKPLEYRFLCRDSIGRPILITHIEVNEKTLLPKYWVSHYVNELAPDSIEKFMKKHSVKHKEEVHAE